MSVPFAGFLGPTYQLRNKQAAVERTCNFYPSVIEAQEEGAKARIILQPSPANSSFSELPVPAPLNQPCRGLISWHGVPYGVNGNQVFGMNPDGTYNLLAPIKNDGKPVSMVANGNGQIFIASAGLGYVLTPLGNGLGSVVGITTAAFLGAAFSTFQDGYILNVVPNSNKYQISGDQDVPVGDATRWDAGNVSVQAGQADLLAAILSSKEYVRILGDQRSQIHVDVGNSGVGQFPFASYNQTFIETGIAAVHSIVDLGFAHMWIGKDVRGIRAAWLDQSFNPQRVSNFAVEEAWKRYVRLDDAVAFAYIWAGHLFYQITFPTAVANNPTVGFPMAPPSATSYTGATWVYDVTASQLAGVPLWHERSYQTAQGFSVQRSEMFYCSAYGRILVGSTGVDGNPGAIYEYRDDVYTDCGADIDGSQMQRPIVRERIAVHQWSKNKRLIANRIEFELAKGEGLDGDPTAVGADPQMYLRWSKDGGKTFGNEQNIAVGKIGEFGKRVYQNRPIQGRDIVLWVRCVDPIYWSLIAAEWDIFECGEWN